MPRRKQDCPKRMKWELENQARLAKAGRPGGSSEIVDEPMQITPEPDEDDSMSASDDDDTGSGEWVPEIPELPRNNVPKRESPINGNSNSSSRFNVSTSQPIGESPLDLSVSQPKTVSPPTLSRKHKTPVDGRAPWNGSVLHPNPDLTSKALEKMSELSRVGATESNTSPNVKGSTSSWQAQWLAQSACGTKDVLKCVCCRLTFPSLSALSLHMKEAKHGPPLPASSPKSVASSGNTGNHANATSPTNDSLLLKETVHLPRKLVRGQDVWLGKGAEQTRQILKCMWCGQSFRSLAEMTSHMQQTQHYTNIISQEQLISWRSHEDKSASTTSHVSAVLTCKVCDQAFSSLKELSNHMVKNSHYKEHIMRSITESGSRRRQSREKRKKSLPVRKLLELERANTGTKKEILISCEKCAEKVPASTFVEHLRVCEKSDDMNSTKNKSIKNSTGQQHDNVTIKQRKNSTEKDKEADDKKEPSSVLNAIEKMIEKSFDYQAKGPNNANTGISSSVGTSILKRLGIDESVDYTKPLVDPTAFPTTMHLRPTHHRPKSVSSEPSEQRERTPTSSESPQNSATEEVEDKVLLEDGPEEQIPQASPRNKATTGGGASSKMNSLSALNSMFELIGGGGGGGGGGHESGSAKSPPSPSFAQVNRNQQHSSPISALQKFCDTRTESTTASSSRPASTSSSNSQSPAGLDGSGLLGMNWPISESDNMFKCNFCETSFMSKGAYRHHLAKMHFVKEDKLPGGGGGNSSGGNGGSGTGAMKDENPVHADSPASKFIKYSELAKQLSSK